MQDALQGYAHSQMSCQVEAMLERLGFQGEFCKHVHTHTHTRRMFVQKHGGFYRPNPNSIPNIIKFLTGHVAALDSDCKVLREDVRLRL